MDPNELAYVFILICSIPASLLLREIRGEIRGIEASRVYSSFFGLMAAMMFSSWRAHFGVIAVGICLFIIRQSEKFVSILAFAILLPIRTFWDLDGLSNAFLLISTLRLVIFATDLSDGLINNDDKLDLIFKYMVYVYSLPGIFTGPVVPAWLFFKNSVKEKIPEISKLCLNASICGCGSLLLNPLFQQMLHDASLSQFQLFPLLLITPWFFRMRCYFAWYLSEAALLCLNLREDGWGTNCPNLFGSERSITIASAIRAWNSSVQKFFAKYIFSRLKNIPQRALFTMALSAWWHGTEAGLYLLFIGTWIAQLVERFYIGRIPKIASWLLTNSLTNFLVLAFILKKDLHIFIQFSQRVNHIYILTPLFVASLFALLHQLKPLFFS